MTIRRLQCKYCGAPIEQGIAGKITCPYCGSIFLQDELLPVSKEVEPSVGEEEPFVWQCPFCDAGNPEEAEFCRECGCERIEYPGGDEEPEMGEGTTFAERRQWLCPDCGTLNNIEVLFCNHCGRHHM